MKKIAVVLLIAFLTLSCLFAGDFKFGFTDLDIHPEILYGFLPTNAKANLRYNGFSIIPERHTQIELTFGGGYRQRQIFQDSETGKPVAFGSVKQAEVFDETNIMWGAKLSQGFGSSWVEAKDLITLYLGYEGRYEEFHDSCLLLSGGGGWPKKENKKINLGRKEKLQPQKLDEWIKYRATQTVYPELQKDSNTTNIIYTGAILNWIDDKMVTTDGFSLEFKAQFAPKSLSERSDYIGWHFNAIAGKTLYEARRANGLNKFSIVFLDRTNFSYLSGDAVPTFASHSYSLGRKMRGFDSNSYNNTYALVNNLDLRISGPEPIIDGIFPRLILFMDLGYYWGEFQNSSAKDDGCLASTGAQLEVSINDAVDIGFQIAYLLKGKNIRTDDKVVTGAFLFLDF